jgi:hypothetical protein
MNYSTPTQSNIKIPVLSIFPIFLVCYFFINFILAPANPLYGGPWSPDDYQALAFLLKDYTIFTPRPVSIAAKFIFAATNAKIFYFSLQLLTVLYATLVTYFIFNFFALRGRQLYFYLPLVGLLAFSMPYLLEYSHDLGLITDLCSCLFGIATMLFLLKAFRQHPKWYVAALLTYFLCIFSKEDFILPPLLLMIYFWIVNFSFEKNSLRTRSLTLASVSMLFLLGLFFIFNFITILNPFITGAHNSTIYHRSLSILDLWKAFHLYFLHHRYVLFSTLVWLALSVAWLYRANNSTKFKILVILFSILLLAAPYLIIINHANPYYAYTWFPWEATFILSALYAIPSKLTANTKKWIATLFVLFILLITQRERNSISHWFANVSAVNQNILSSVLQQKNLINTQTHIGLIGLGAFTPWANNTGSTNSETRGLYLNTQLGFKNAWIIYVKPDDKTYSINEGDQFNPHHHVNVLTLEKLCDFPHQYNFIFDAQGHGTLVQGCKNIK